MSRSTDSLTHRLSMRLSRADLVKIDRAARLRRRSRARFVGEAAVRAAEEVLVDRALVQMNATGFAAFMAALAEPALPVPEMVEMFKRKAPWESNRTKS